MNYNRAPLPDDDTTEYIPRKIVKGKWRPWFAWRPVKTISGNKAWLCFIYKRSVTNYVDIDEWNYREYGSVFDILKE